MSSEAFVIVSIWKEKRTALHHLFLKWNDNKNFGWHLAFSIKFLAIGLSNEKNIVYIKKIRSI